MSTKKVSKAKRQKERSFKKIKKVIKQKGIKSGKLSKGKVLHHIKPVVNGGKTTKKNTRIITKGKHKKIHKNRRKRGKI